MGGGGYDIPASTSWSQSLRHTRARKPMWTPARATSDAQAITNVPFPEGAGIVTKCPIVVQTRWHRDSPDEWRVDDTACEAQAVCKTISEAQAKRLRKARAKVSADPIRVQYTSSSAVDLEVVDLPGIIHHGPGGQEVEDLIHAQIRSPKTLILIVREADRDDETQKALALANQYDLSGSRTLQVSALGAALVHGGPQRTSFFFIKDRPQGPPQGTTNRQPPTTSRQPPAATNRQPPTTAKRHQPPITNRRQPPPTTTNRQSPTANRQSPPTIVKHMSYTRSFCKTAVQEHHFFPPLKDPPALVPAYPHAYDCV